VQQKCDIVSVGDQTGRALTYRFFTKENHRRAKTQLPGLNHARSQINPSTPPQRTSAAGRRSVSPISVSPATSMASSQPVSPNANEILSLTNPATPNHELSAHDELEERQQYPMFTTNPNPRLSTKLNTEQARQNWSKFSQSRTIEVAPVVPGMPNSAPPPHTILSFNSVLSNPCVPES
jgi:hypothetical protein